MNVSEVVEGIKAGKSLAGEKGVGTCLAHFSTDFGAKS